MLDIEKEYTKYRWFFTSLGKLVIGGKSAEQNDLLLKKLKKYGSDFYIMHTSSPGSPFSVIISPKEVVAEKEIKEAAIFTGCFSKLWKSGKKNSIIDIFFLSDVFKNSSMKQGTWSVKKVIKKVPVKLELILTFQKDKLRAIPEISLNKNSERIAKITPGDIEKSLMINKLQVIIPKSLSKEEILSALPSGGFKIIKYD